MKLEVGMYVRTKYGIAKITRYEHYWINGEEWNYITTDIGRNFEIDLILKASHNIIDLIEVGDYVNGVLVENIYSREEDKIYFHTFGEEIMIEVAKENLNNIVTKEQFEQMQYKVGE